MKKILVPVDFSTSTRNSAEYAASLGIAFNADICLLHVYTEPVPVIEGGAAAVLLSDELRKGFESRLADEKSFLEKKYALNITTRLFTGFRTDAIKDMAEKWHADIIVMGRNITKKQMIFGSTILKIIRKTEVPVLIIPEGVTYQLSKRIVLAVDYEEMAYHTCIDVLYNMVKKFDAALTVLHIEKKEPVMSGAEVAGKLHWDRVLSKLTYTYDSVENENTEQGILHFIDQHPTDILTMVAHHHTILERWFGNVHTRSLTFDVNLPLLVLKN